MHPSHANLKSIDVFDPGNRALLVIVTTLFFYWSGFSRLEVYAPTRSITFLGRAKMVSRVTGCRLPTALRKREGTHHLGRLPGRGHPEKTFPSCGWWFQSTRLLLIRL